MAQKPEVIDSLWNKYRYSENDSIKLKAANYLAFHYIFRTPKRADSILRQAIAFANNKKQYFGLTELTNTKGIYFDVLGQKDSSKVYFNKALNLSREYKYTNIEVMCINNLGMFCWNNGEFKEAIGYFYEALDFSKTNFPDNDRTINTYLNNIGLIYQELEQFEKAIDFHKEALEIRIKYDLTKNIAQSYNNLAICTKEIGDLDTAETYINLALDFAKKSNQPQMVYGFYDNLGNILNLQGKYNEAINAYLKALETPEEYSKDISQKFIAYSNLISAYNRTKQYKKALDIVDKADHLFKQDSSLYNFSGSFFENAAKTYYALRENEKGDQYFESYLQLKDSLFSEENAKALADVEAKLKTKEKEAELAKTKASLLQKDIQVRQKNLLLYGSIAAILIILLMSYLVVKSKQLKNNQIKKEAELQTALAKIELKNKLEEQRLRISRDLHDNIGSQLTFVISGLQYIQFQKKLKYDEVKQKLEQLSQFTQNTIYELRDTIWAMNKEQILLSDLIIRTQNFISQININESIRIDLSKTDEAEATTIEFNAIEGIQIFRILQEAINNAIKHAQANTILLQLKTGQDLIRFEISDDGIGFDKDNVDFGNGLKNLEKRAEKLNAKLEVISQLNEGTSLKLDIHRKHQRL
jgi:signal transduction histidine kinase/Flp pilus assembly protein TadD